MSGTLRITLRVPSQLRRVRTAAASSQSRRMFSSSSRAMSNITPIFTRLAAPPVGPYSQAILTPHAIYCSGQLPADSSGNLITSSSMAANTAACIKNLSVILSKAGSSLEKIVKVQIFLTDMNHFTKMNEEYERWIRHKPARSCVVVKELPKGAAIEIECVALP